MPRSAKSKANEMFLATQKGGNRVLMENQKARKEREKKTARLKALRLANMTSELGTPHGEFDKT